MKGSHLAWTSSPRHLLGPGPLYPLESGVEFQSHTARLFLLTARDKGFSVRPGVLTVEPGSRRERLLDTVE